MVYIEKLEKLGYPRDFILEFKEHIQIFDFEKGDIIKDYNTNFDSYIYFVLSGGVKLYFYLNNSYSFVAESSAGDIIGLEFSLRNKARFPKGEFDLVVEAMEDVEIMTIPSEKLLKTKMGEDFWKAVAIKLANNYIHDFNTMLEKNILGHKAYFLKFLDNKNYKIEYENTQEIAEMLNMNLRTLQRTIKYFKEKGIITKKKGIIKVIDINAFKKLRDEYMYK